VVGDCSLDDAIWGRERAFQSTSPVERGRCGIESYRVVAKPTLVNRRDPHATVLSAFGRRPWRRFAYSSLDRQEGAPESASTRRCAVSWPASTRHLTSRGWSDPCPFQSPSSQPSWWRSWMRSISSLRHVMSRTRSRTRGRQDRRRRAGRKHTATSSDVLDFARSREVPVLGPFSLRQDTPGKLPPDQLGSRTPIAASSRSPTDRTQWPWCPSPWRGRARGP